MKDEKDVRVHQWIVYYKTKNIKGWNLISYWYKRQDQALMAWDAKKQLVLY